MRIVSEIPETDKAWFAGFFDGEGSVRIAYTRSRDRYNLEIHLVNTFLQSLQKCLLIWGCGSIATQRRQGRVHHLWATCYDWRTSNKQARLILQAIQPYLCVKREEVEVALQFALKHNVHKPKSLPRAAYNQDGLAYKKSLEGIRAGRKPVSTIIEGRA